MKTRAVSMVLLLAVAFSGCVTTGDGNSDDGTSGMPTDDDFQGLDYIECMEHEDMERCWNVFVPKTVDLSQDVPMVIDLHGNTLTMQNQRDLSEFDDLAICFAHAITYFKSAAIPAPSPLVLVGVLTAIKIISELSIFFSI